MFVGDFDSAPISRGQLVTSACAPSLHGQARLFEAMVQAGASGYVLKDDIFADLTLAIRAVAAGQTYFSPGLSLPGNDDPGHIPPPP